MAELAKTVSLKLTYQKVATLSSITFDTSKTYILQNLSESPIYFIESTTAPTDDSVRGVMLLKGDTFGYKPTASYDLYAMGALSQLTIIEKVA